MAASKRIVLITGGNNGIGLAACELFSTQPGYHCIMASRSLEKGQQALSSLKSSHPSADISLVQLDVTSDTSIAAAVEHVKSTHGGRLDVLINNAGICPVEFSRELLRECFETNSVSPGLVTQAFAPLLLRSSEPRLVYVSSVLGSITTRGVPDDLAYAADFKAYRMSKAALDMLVACDAWEYRGKVKVFAFCPGYVISDLAGMRQAKEEQGVAKTPDTSARGLLAIAGGKRDGEQGKFVHGEEAGNVYPW